MNIKTVFVDKKTKRELLEEYENIFRSQRVKLAMDYIDKPGKVLEVGCSYGTISYFMADKKKCTVDAYEINKERLDLAQRYFSHPNIRYFSSDILDVKGKELYDYIILLEVIEHIDDPYGFLKHLKQLLKRDGCLIISTPNANDYLQVIRNLKLYTKTGRIQKARHIEERNIVRYGNMDDHLYSWTWESFYRFLNRVGFKYKKSDIVAFNPISYGNFKLFGSEMFFLAKIFKPFCTNLVFKVGVKK